MRNGANKAAVLVLLKRGIYDVWRRLGLGFHNTRSKFKVQAFRSWGWGCTYRPTNSRVRLLYKSAVFFTLKTFMYGGTNGMKVETLSNRVCNT
jgi:hypothetical protein